MLRLLVSSQRHSCLVYLKSKGVATVLSESVLDQNGPKCSPNDHFGQNDLIRNWILAFNGPKWTKMVHFGPFRAANRTLAIPDISFEVFPCQTSEERPFAVLFLHFKFILVLQACFPEVIFKDSHGIFLFEHGIRGESHREATAALKRKRQERSGRRGWRVCKFRCKVNILFLLW